MKNSHSTPIPGRSGGFTLLELLVVIAIIGILAGLMFPAVNGALKRAENAHAENTAYNLRNAITTYFTEYRKYPVENPADSQDTTIRSTEELMDALLGAESERGLKLNPRKIAFYSGRPAKPKGGGKYIKGILLDENGGGALWDPWGDHYYVTIDTDYNNRVDKPSWDTANASTFLSQGVIVWAAGKDEDENTRGDNVMTW